MVGIRQRLFTALFVAVGASTVLLAAVVIILLRSGPPLSPEVALRERAETLAFSVLDEAEEDPALHSDPKKALHSALEKRLADAPESLGLPLEELKVTVIDDGGHITFDSEGPGYKALLLRHGETTVIAVSVPLFLKGLPAGKLFLSQGREGAGRESPRRERIVIAGASVAGAVVFLISVAAVLWATSPVRALVRYAGEIEAGKEIAAPDLADDELGEVAKRLEETRKSLDGAQYVEKYVQTLTHELKSPLSVLRGAAELLEEKMSPEQRAIFIGNIRKETARIQDLVDRLLLLLAIEGRRELRDVEHVALAPLVRGVVDSMEPLLASKEIVPDLDLDASAAVWGELFLLRQALANILKNAVEFSPVGGALGLRLTVDGGQAVITVDDVGPGVPDYALSRIFEKFYSLGRPDTGRRSSGLGLPFTREVALLHNGDVTVENMTGGGVRVRLSVPVEPPSAA